MIEQDGWETVYASDEVVRTEPFLVNDVRLAVERLRREERASRPVDLPPAPIVSHRRFAARLG